MQLMGDALTVLGSRLGIAWDPNNKASFLIRHGKHPGIPLGIKAGLRIGDKSYSFPLCKGGGNFEFMDQGMTATTMTLGGIVQSEGLHVKLTVTIPFKPRDSKFSTIPAVLMSLEIDRLNSNFRWCAQTEQIVMGTLFLSFEGDSFEFINQGDNILVKYLSPQLTNEIDESEVISIKSLDKITIMSGKLRGTSIEEEFTLKKGECGTSIQLAWCAYDKPVLTVLNEISEFKYTENFRDLDEVIAWTRINYYIIKDNSERVDEILHSHNIGESINHLMAQTLHAWLMNSWWVVRSNGQDWFTIWEGSCYFHSTVDVEYTQAPFYLALWPELLELELNEWCYFAKVGRDCIGDIGEGTLFLSHDMGRYTDCSVQMYPHDMEVEESANYILLAYTHWRRTGIATVIKSHWELIKKLMDFIIACDTTGNGIPDKGCANTIDDASPAVQFGSEQIYIGVKAMAACKAGAAILEYIGHGDIEKYTAFGEKAIKTIEEVGWKADHYVVTLSQTLEGIKNPWTGEEMKGKLHGWDAYHIYTPNGLALLDMVGFNTGLSDERLCIDMEKAVFKTLGKYGCKHSSYEQAEINTTIQEGLAASASKVGWVSMNMLRDIAGAYRGLDFMALADRYWDWQLTTNTQQLFSFFETFYGNNLNFYPRGVAVFGYLDAAAGFSYDAVNNTKSFAPIRNSLRIPLLSFADWDNKTVPYLVSKLIKGKIEYEILDLTI